MGGEAYLDGGTGEEGEAEEAHKGGERPRTTQKAGDARENTRSDHSDVLVERGRGCKRGWYSVVEAQTRACYSLQLYDWANAGS
eukprot:1179373-Prorocentrum_minimum.AAC.11